MWVVVGIMSTNDGAMDADIGRDGRRKMGPNFFPITNGVPSMTRRRLGADASRAKMDLA
jgi:hypothetical protein